MNRHIPGDLLDRPDPGADKSLKAPPTPQFDLADYAQDMANFAMTEDKQREFLETLWSIMRSFAEMGFMVDICGQLFEGFNEAAIPDSGGVGWSDPTNAEKPAGKESSP